MTLRGRSRRAGTSVALAGAFALGASLNGAAAATPDHLVVVIEENHDYNQIIGNAGAPYINQLASSGLSFVNSHPLVLNSIVNYLDLFSGSNQGVTDDTDARFPAANLGSELQAAGRRFVGYAESLPADGFTGASAPDYVRIHNPWTYFENLFVNGSNAAVNKVFNPTNFPTASGTNYSFLPDVSFVVPNLLNDMHGEDGSPLTDDQLIARGDAWLQSNLDSYAQWARTHHSLLMVTWDEGNYTATTNHIPTIVTGDPALLHAGLSDQSIDHFSVLRTIEDMFGLPALGGSTTAAPLATDAKGALMPIPALLMADANNNGRVDFADLLTLGQHYGESGATWATGDFNADGAVGFDDLLILTQHYGQTATAAEPAAVPEPTALLPAIFSLIAVLPPQRRVSAHIRPHQLT